MTLPNTGNVLETLTQLTQVERAQALLHDVKTLSIPEFVCLLDFINTELQQFLKAIDLINNEALENILEKTLEAITLKIGQILQADCTTIFLVDTEKGQLWTKIAQGENEKPLEICLPSNVGIVGHVATTRECLNIADAYNHPLFNPELDKRTDYYTRNILCMPVFSSKENVVAVVQLTNKAGNVPFNSEDEQHFRDFGASIGIILESCQSFYQAARNQRGAAALLKATQTLGQSLDLETTLRSVMDRARNLMQADRSTLFLLSKETNELWTKIPSADNKTLLEIRIPANRGIAGYVVSTGEVLNIPDAYQDSRFDPTTDRRTGYLTRNILCMPVRNSNDNLIGVIQLINKLQDRFTSADEELMDKFNIQAGIALQNAILFESIKEQKKIQKNIFQSIVEGIISTDKHGKINLINQQARRLLGLSDEEEVNGKIISDVVQFLEKESEFCKWIEAALAVTSKSNHKQLYSNQTLITDSLEQHQVNLSIDRLTDVNDNNSVCGALVMLEDISDCQYNVKTADSTVLTLSGSFDGIARLEFLFQTGQLTEVLGIPIFDMRQKSL